MASQLTKIKQQTFHHKFYNHLMFCLVAEKCQKAMINYYRTSENKKKIESLAQQFPRFSWETEGQRVNLLETYQNDLS